MCVGGLSDSGDVRAFNSSEVHLDGATREDDRRIGIYVVYLEATDAARSRASQPGG